MKTLKNFKGVIAFLLILTIINCIPIERKTTNEYVKGNNENNETEVAAQI